MRGRGGSDHHPVHPGGQRRSSVGHRARARLSATAAVTSGRSSVTTSSSTLANPLWIPRNADPAQADDSKGAPTSRVLL
jgi:hypothetical protein